MTQIRPVDLPRSLDFLSQGLSKPVQDILKEKQEAALRNHQWDIPVDTSLDANDLDFVAYWLYKGGSPILEPRDCPGLKESFLPFQVTQVDLCGSASEPVMTMSACGDLMFAKYIEESKNRLYRRVESCLFQDKYTFGNLESTLSSGEIREFAVSEQGETPHINITPAQYDALVKHEEHTFDVLQIANNHILDCGEDGAQTTMAQLKQDGIDFVGVYQTLADSQKPTITQVNGLKIGWVSHTYSLNGQTPPQAKRWMVNVTQFHAGDADVSRVREQIAQAKDAGCDLVVLALHWGLEFELYPHPKQVEWAHEFAQLGADCIIGHHPHVIQPFEVFETQDGRAVPIFYSLGNLTPAFGSAETVLSLIVNLTIGRVQEKICFTGLSITPVVFMEEQDGDGEVCATLVPLKELCGMDLDEETRAYVEQIIAYGQYVFGSDWR